MMVTTEKIQGLWHLQSMEQRYDDGRVLYPFGQDAEGRIFYAEYGHLFVAIQRGSRQPFTSGKQWTASSEEKASAYNDYLSYCGRYEIDGDHAKHLIEISLFPDWIGACQVRSLRLESGLLYIGARLDEGTAEARTSLLIWKRPATEN